MKHKNGDETLLGPPSYYAERHYEDFLKPVEVHIDGTCHCGNDIDIEFYSMSHPQLLPGTVVKTHARVSECKLCKQTLTGAL